jgi:Na+/H+ antiporter NhaA
MEFDGPPDGITLLSSRTSLSKRKSARWDAVGFAEIKSIFILSGIGLCLCITIPPLKFAQTNYRGKGCDYIPFADGTRIFPAGEV